MYLTFKIFSETMCFQPLTRINRIQWPSHQ